MFKSPRTLGLVNTLEGIGLAALIVAVNAAWNVLASQARLGTLDWQVVFIAAGGAFLMRFLDGLETLVPLQQSQPAAPAPTPPPA